MVSIRGSKVAIATELAVADKENVLESVGVIIELVC
jgi:hypothetical protein